MDLSYLTQLIFEVFMRNIDIYSKERLIFIKKKYSLMRVQGVISKDQLIDLVAVFGGLLLVWLLLALWEPQNPNEPRENKNLTRLTAGDLF